MATKPRKKRKGSSSKKIVVIGKKAAPRKKRHSVGATHHHTPAKRRKKRNGGLLGSTGAGSSLKQIAIMAVGVAAGAGITHIILRPVEKRLMDKWPMIGKFIAAGEVFLGGAIALKGKNNFTKSLGVGILAGGVHGLMKQANIYKNIPGIQGTDDYHRITVPISGGLTEQISGLLQDRSKRVRTEVVAGMNHTSNLAGMDRTNQVAGELDDVWQFPDAKGL